MATILRRNWVRTRVGNAHTHTHTHTHTHCHILLLPHIALILDVFTKTGVSLDPDYSVKAVRGMLGEMERNPGRFAGRRVLFIHTGELGTW